METMESLDRLGLVNYFSRHF
jgi:hypothetical protein